MRTTYRNNVLHACIIFTCMLIFMQSASPEIMPMWGISLKRFSIQQHTWKMEYSYMQSSDLNCIMKVSLCMCICVPCVCLNCCVFACRRTVCLPQLHACWMRDVTFHILLLKGGTCNVDQPSIYVHTAVYICLLGSAFMHAFHSRFVLVRCMHVYLFALNSFLQNLFQSSRGIHEVGFRSFISIGIH